MRIQKFEVVESTNDLARKYILEGNKEPAASWQSIKLGAKVVWVECGRTSQGKVCW